MADTKIKSVDLACKILEYLKDNGGASMQQLADVFDLSTSTVHRHLSTLRSHGYVVQEGRTYHVGLRFVEMAEHAMNRKPSYEIAEEITDTLARQTGDRSAYVAEENGLGVVLSSETGEHGILADLTMGQRVHLHSSAVGKAILAYSSHSDVVEILRMHGLPKITESTITDRSALMEELDLIRERGYSINRSERIQGLHAVGVPVKSEDGTVIGAFSVSGPTRRMTDERISGEIATILLNAAEEYELRLRHV